MSLTHTSELSARPDHIFPLEGGLAGSLLVGLGGALVVEGSALHVWISSRSPAWAWTITSLNAATLVWLWRESRARRRATLTLGDHEVTVALGNQLRCQFPRSAIASAERATWRSVADPTMARDYVNSAKPLEPNVIITLSEPVEARLPLGIRKRLSRLGVRVGEPDQLLVEIRPTASGQSPH